MKPVGKLVRLSEETSRIGETTSANDSVMKRVRMKSSLNNAISYDERLIDYCA